MLLVFFFVVCLFFSNPDQVDAQLVQPNQCPEPPAPTNLGLISRTYNAMFNSFYLKIRWTLPAGYDVSQLRHPKPYYIGHDIRCPNRLNPTAFIYEEHYASNKFSL